MKVVLIPYCFYPDKSGGTEVYVENLAAALMRLGVSVIIAAPSGSGEDEFLRNDIKVVKYKVPPLSATSEIYSNSCPVSGEWFRAFLERERPDIVHFHALTRGQSIEMFESAKKMNIPVVLTYHTPTLTCLRGSLLLWGDKICDGSMEIGRCCGCALNSKGIPRFISRIISAVPLRVSEAASRILPHKFGTGLGMKSYVFKKVESVRKQFNLSDRIVAVSNWVRELLLINGVPDDKIIVSRQGIVKFKEDPKTAKAGGPKDKDRLVIGYVGRFEEHKGIKTLVQAIKILPDSYDIRCEIYGIVQSNKNQQYKDEIARLARRDKRILFKDPVPNGKIFSIMKTFDILAIPSYCLETGPLVMFEAFLAGVPVMGSDLGGIAETVQHNVNGILVTPGLARAWSEWIRVIYNDRGLLAKLQKGIPAPRLIETVAGEMAGLYSGLTNKS